jgi:tetratricopeptide (TPR) repeat protein
MRESIRFKAVFLGSVLGGVLVGVVGVASRSAGAQEMADHYRVPSGMSATVSVATLRIPEKAWAHFAKAKAAAEHHRLAESDRETDKALAIAPDFAQAYLLRASLEVQAHKFEAAIADAKEARRVEPDMMLSGIVLAGAYNGLQRYEEARLVLKGLHGLEAATWQAAYEGARAATGLNDIESGLRLSAAALKSAPANFPDVHLVRTNALLRAQRWSEAQEQMELYLQSKEPLERRPQVLAALQNVKRLAREEELQTVASR